MRQDLRIEPLLRYYEVVMLATRAMLTVRDISSMFNSQGSFGLVPL